ncbi:TPA: hypothetical protein PJF92_000095 [Escherichia coli]|nr:hypothetical protein [Escherichia coli]HDH7160034.1 hypothetical protein [Escherichia coli]
MANAFDFELVADDKVSDVITRIDDAVRKLVPVLQNTKDELALGGQDTSDGLDGISDRLNGMSRAARDNVQFVGDMVPPLKMVGELSSKLAGLGALGAAGFGIKRVAESFADASREAYNLDVSAKNAGMRVDEFSRLSGAMQILGSDSQSANASIEAMFKTFNDAASGRNAGALSAMAQIGAQIEKNQDGSVNVLKTMESIARVFPSLRTEQQKTAAEALGLDENGLQLLREGLRLKELLAKSDAFGLTVDPELNNKLADVNSTMNELGASWEGLKAKTKGMIFEGLLSDGSVKDGLEGITDLLSNGDFTGLSHALGLVSSDNAKKLRRIQGDKELYDSLSRRERGAVDGGFYTDAVRKRYDARYGAEDTASQLQNDLLAINSPIPDLSRGNVSYEQSKNNARGFRNHNPGNLRSAPNTTGKSGGFSTFQNDDDGLSAMARQLMLFGDRGNNTINGFIHTYAPRNENDTRAYINSVSGNTGIQAQERVNLHDPETLKAIMAAMIKHENGVQPYSEEQLTKAIQSAITDNRWKGLRRPEILAQQRLGIVSEEQKADGSPPLRSQTPPTTDLVRKPVSRQDEEEGKNNVPAQTVSRTSAPKPSPVTLSTTLPDETVHRQVNSERPDITSRQLTEKTNSQAGKHQAVTNKEIVYDVESSTSVKKSPVISSAQQMITTDNNSGESEQPKTIIQPSSKTSAAERDNLSRAMKEAFEEQTLKLEITMTGRSGESQTVETRNGGRISMPMSY